MLINTKCLEECLAMTTHHGYKIWRQKVKGHPHWMIVHQKRPEKSGRENLPKKRVKVSAKRKAMI